jgi:hypothetical protein
LTSAPDGVITEPFCTGIRTHTWGQTSYNSHDAYTTSTLLRNPTMNNIYKFWREFTTPHTLSEWKWEGNKLTDLPRAAWRDFCRTIRGPILKVLIGDDLVDDAGNDVHRPSLVWVAIFLEFFHKCAIIFDTNCVCHTYG